MNDTGANPQNLSQPTAVAVIPARFASTRFPGKPLCDIAGRPMILHVVERSLAAPSVSRAIVATDDERILRAVQEAGHEAVMTSLHHRSGSDRLAEVARELKEADIVVNVQGDEPLISPQTIERAVRELQLSAEADITTTSEPIELASDVLSPDVVKVVTDEEGRALYFSRSPIPFPRELVQKYGTLAEALEREPALLAGFRKHTGLYAYRRPFLLEYSTWPPSILECAEALEQLRALERGAVIKVVEAAAPSIGVDTPEDLRRVLEMMKS